MCIALFMFVLILGLAIPMISGVIHEEQLRQSSRQLSVYAKTARKLAIEEQRSYVIDFFPGGFDLRPYETNAPGSTNEVAPTELHYELGGDTTLELQRWGEDQWRKPSTANDIFWVFQSSGICEPIRFRFTRPGSSLEMSFNPLTANVQDESHEVQ